MTMFCATPHARPREFGGSKFKGETRRDDAQLALGTYKPAFDALTRSHGQLSVRRGEQLSAQAVCDHIQHGRHLVHGLHEPVCRGLRREGPQAALEPASPSTLPLVPPNALLSTHTHTHTHAHCPKVEVEALSHPTGFKVPRHCLAHLLAHPYIHPNFHPPKVAIIYSANTATQDVEYKLWQVLVTMYSLCTYSALTMHSPCHRPDHQQINKHTLYAVLC